MNSGRWLSISHCACRHRMFLLFVLLMPLSGRLFAQFGDAPRLSLGAIDVYAKFRLPALKDQPADALWRAVSATQVLSRAKRLGITKQSATEAWKESEETLVRAEGLANAPQPGVSLPFRGSTASGLNLFIAKSSARHIVVLSSSLRVDVPVEIRRDHLELDFGDTRLNAMTLKSPYVVRVEHAEDVRVRGGSFSRGPWAILVLQSRSVILQGITMVGLSGGGILLSNSRDCVIWGNTLSRLGGAPIMLQGSVTDTVIAHNSITRNVSPSNWRAGIVLTDRNADLALDPDSLLNPDLFGVREDLMQNRVHIPHDNLIALNEIRDNQSSAIYSDGAARTVITGNRIEGNSKEGICLDNGSLADVVVDNLFRSNGKRWGKSDSDLRREFVFDFGRAPDGSSMAKVPAVSIDNGAYNEVMFNDIQSNYGGGIKFVRTAFYNVVGLNTVIDNNEGQSKNFHFFGIELGSAKADTLVRDLNFFPSQGNIIFGNLIRGDHYAGIFLAAGSDGNKIFDNSVFGATNWALESAQRQANETLNNLSNLPSRNIDPHLDPALGGLSSGRFDSPPP